MILDDKGKNIFSIERLREALLDDPEFIEALKDKLNQPEELRFDDED